MKTAVCLVCRLKYKNIATRDAHGKRVHGEPFGQWQGIAEEYPGVTFVHAVPGRRVRPGDNSPLPDLIQVKTRVIPPKEERDQAEGLEALPWIKFPTTADACDTMARALGELATTMPNTSQAFTGFMTLRDHLLALGVRLRKQKAAA